jgi:hypothetical protein
MSIEQYQADVREGDIGTARRRLASYIACTAYEPELCSTIGDLCMMMKDPTEAAKWYIIGSETNDEIESCIEKYIHANRKHPGAIIANIPGRARLASTADYPEIVQDRLREASIENREIKGTRYAPDAPNKWSDRSRTNERIATVIIITAVVLFFLGAYTAVRWVVGFFL